MSSGVEFDEDKFSYSTKPRVSGVNSAYGQPNKAYMGQNDANSHESRMVKFLMRHGLAKSPKSAEMILIVLAVLNFIITLLVINIFLF